MFGAHYLINLSLYIYIGMTLFKKWFFKSFSEQDKIYCSIKNLSINSYVKYVCVKIESVFSSNL